ncbi:MAG: Nif3-like dinuclear metal center hexameric protein, partial [Clostridia bacterium]|nr:Nif3-like dinuclear metal center hexameric protein [Clostridia bacterium]
FADEAAGEPYGLGRVGALSQEMPLTDFAEFVKERLSCGRVAVCDARRAVKSAAVCSGSCDEEILRAAVSSGADTLVTGEIKHSLMIEALRAGVNVVAAGHFATENVVCPVLLRQLSERFRNVEFRLAEAGVSPMFFI